MYGSKPANLEVAHRGARKPHRRFRGPVLALLEYAAQHLDAVRVERSSEENVEKEQLGDDVDDVQQLDEDVAADEVVSMTTFTQRCTEVRTRRWR